MPAANEQPDKAAEYEKMKKELKESLMKKRNIDKNLAMVEEQIYMLESAYIEEAQNGNIVKGFDNYMKSNQNKRKAVITDQDRIFSMSSAAYVKSKLKEDDGL